MCGEDSFSWSPLAHLQHLSRVCSLPFQVLEATGTQGIYNQAVGAQNSVVSFANTANYIRNEFFR